MPKPSEEKVRKTLLAKIDCDKELTEILTEGGIYSDMVIVDPPVIKKYKLVKKEYTLYEAFDIARAIKGRFQKAYLNEKNEFENSWEEGVKIIKVLKGVHQKLMLKLHQKRACLYIFHKEKAPREGLELFCFKLKPTYVLYSKNYVLLVSDELLPALTVLAIHRRESKIRILI